ncbi:hypothetical protein VTO42DRAFT_7789 [Malbranchea cinnamomea]
MQLLPALLSLSCAVSLASGHFHVEEPPPRGYDNDKVTQFPCGGQSVSDSRHAVSLENPEISLVLEMGHDQAALQVLLGLGNDPGSNYNITLVPTLREQGMGTFCLPHISLSEEVLGTQLEDGMNATVQVVTNGDPVGGLYNCIDITFSSDAVTEVPVTCTNSTGVTAEFFTGEAAGRNANESTPNGQPQGGSGSDGASPSESGNVAAPLQTAAWGILGAAVAGGIALL